MPQWAFAQQRLTTIVFGEGVTGQIARHKEGSATVYDEAGKAILSGSETYIRDLAGSDGEVAEWDVRADRVRLRGSARETWLACSELLPMSVACTLRASTNDAGGLLLEPIVRPTVARSLGFGRLPICPGDPRCPQVKR